MDSTNKDCKSTLFYVKYLIVRGVETKNCTQMKAKRHSWCGLDVTTQISVNKIPLSKSQTISPIQIFNADHHRKTEEEWMRVLDQGIFTVFVCLFVLNHWAFPCQLPWYLSQDLEPSVSCETREAEGTLGEKRLFFPFASFPASILTRTCTPTLHVP